MAGTPPDLFRGPAMTCGTSRNSCERRDRDTRAALGLFPSARSLRACRMRAPGGSGRHGEIPPEPRRGRAQARARVRRLRRRGDRRRARRNRGVDHRRRAWAPDAAGRAAGLLRRGGGLRHVGHHLRPLPHRRRAAHHPAAAGRLRLRRALPRRAGGERRRHPPADLRQELGGDPRLRDLQARRHRPGAGCRRRCALPHADDRRDRGRRRARRPRPAHQVGLHQGRREARDRRQRRCRRRLQDGAAHHQGERRRHPEPDDDVQDRQRRRAALSRLLGRGHDLAAQGRSPCWRRATSWCARRSGSSRP